MPIEQKEEYSKSDIENEGKSKYYLSFQVLDNCTESCRFFDVFHVFAMKLFMNDVKFGSIARTQNKML